MQPLRRPNRSTNSPRNVPKMAAELNPVRNSVPTSTPYDWYRVYMFVPCSQSASMTVRYTARYLHWNLPSREKGGGGEGRGGEGVEGGRQICKEAACLDL